MEIQLVKKSFIAIFLIASSLLGIEIPIPEIESTPVFFSSTSDGEVVIGWIEYDYSYDYGGWIELKNYYMYLWKSDCYGWEPEPTYELKQFTIGYNDPYPAPHSSKSCSCGFFFLDCFDRMHYSSYTYESWWSSLYGWGNTSITEYNPPDSSPELYFFKFNLDYENSDGEWEDVTSKYYFTKEGEFIAMESHYGYRWPMIIIDFVKIIPCYGTKKDYNISADSIIPRFNSTTDTPHFISKEDYKIRQMFFNDTITSRVLYESENLITSCDFQADINDNLHIIWTEDNDGMYYASLINNILSSRLFMGTPEFYDYAKPKLLINDAGDMVVYSLPDYHNFAMWFKSCYETEWEFSLSDHEIIGSGCLKVFLNDEGGISLIVNDNISTVPQALLWHSEHREAPLLYYMYSRPSWKSIEKSCFTPDGNFALLVMLTDDSYIVFRNTVPGDCPTQARFRWQLYE